MTSYTSWSTRPASSTGRGVVQSLQALRHGWRDGEAGAAAGNGHVVVVELHPGLQVGVELDHADGDPERQTRLPLISGHYHYLGTLSPRPAAHTGRGRPSGWFCPARGGASSRPAAAEAGHPRSSDQGPLPGPQAKGLADTMATRHPYVVGGEARNRQLAASGAAQRQRGAIDSGLWTRLHATAGPSPPSVMSRSPALGSVGPSVFKILRARWADRALLHARQRTTSRPSGRPPAATSRTWSAVRSAEGWAGWPPSRGTNR
jgi:hypothetical protein